MPTLRSNLIRLASENPSLRPHLLPLLEKHAAKDTADFVLWALWSQHPVPTDRVISWLERHGVEEKVDLGETRKGKPLAKGDLVEIQANNAPSDLRDLLEPYHLKRGNVVDVDGNDVVIQIQAGGLLRVPGGAMPGKSSGVYRASQMDEQGDRVSVEIVYAPAEDRVSRVAIEVVESYVEKGMAAGEDRSENYFTGVVPNWKTSKEGHPYFMMWTQQRGGRPRSMSPDKGIIYYIGVVGDRPSTWKKDLQKLRASEEGAQPQM